MMDGINIDTMGGSMSGGMMEGAESNKPAADGCQQGANRSSLSLYMLLLVKSFKNIAT